jgi:hypothetical protein
MCDLYHPHPLCVEPMDIVLAPTLDWAMEVNGTWTVLKVTHVYIPGWKGTVVL